MRLRKSNPAEPGLARRGRRYLDDAGAAVTDAEVIERVKGLAIPPAWADVWICRSANGHLQAVGTDSAGRRQYIYHPQWRAQRDSKKHDRTLAFASALPRARRACTSSLRHAELDRSRVLAAAFRILDISSLRVGSESYADEHKTFGLATLRRKDVSVHGPVTEFCFKAKGGIRQSYTVRNPALARVVGELLDRGDRNPELLAWRENEHWHDVRSGDINEYIREVTRGEYTAKDFRTWNATVLMAQLLGMGPAPGSESSTKRSISAAYQAVAEYLGNTPAIARASYVDPRVVELYRDGVVLPRRSLPRSERNLPIHGHVERAVLRLLKDPIRTPR